MKFLIISHIKEVFYTLPPERQTELLTASLSWIEKYRKAGKCKEIYWIPGWNRAVVIWEADSGEDAIRATAENPMNSYNDMEAYALISISVLIDGRSTSISALSFGFPSLLSIKYIAAFTSPAKALSVSIRTIAGISASNFSKASLTSVLGSFFLPAPILAPPLP